MLREINDVIAELDTHGQALFATTGEWSLHEMVEVLLQNVRGATVYISTYSLTEFPVRVLSNLIDEGKIAALHVLVDYQFQKRYPKVNQFLQEITANVGYAAVHAKILVIDCATPVTIVGSANWTVNPRLEAGIVTKSKDAAEAFIDLIKQNIYDAEREAS